MDISWRLIDSGPCDAFFNMALDEAIATFVRRGDAPVTLRFYGWERPAVSLGHFQKAGDVDLEYCRHNSIAVVRRPTGGRAILHGDELTYSLSARTDQGHFAEGLLSSYRKIGTALSRAFRKIGLPAEVKEKREKGRVLTRSPLCFRSSSYGELLMGNKKVAGSAQRRWRDGMLQQGSIPYAFDERLIQLVFRTEEPSVLNEQMTGLRCCLPELRENELKRAISASFEETFGVSLLPSRPSPEEVLLAQELEVRKYRLPAGQHVPQAGDRR